jgi:tRNA-dihydrouridine synthase B
MTLTLAPLHGVTNRVFRKAWFSHFTGFDAAVAPFILSARTDRFKPSLLKDIIPDPATHTPLVPQILGNDSEGFIDTAKLIAGLGYREVNWNLGCPYPMVTKKIRGSGLLPYPERIEKFLDEVIPCLSALGMSLSIKLRLGLSDPEEIMRLMPTLNGHPIKKIIIHPRVGAQMYRGCVNLDGFARASEMSAHPVSYNGDITDHVAFKSLQMRFPKVDEWMIGRGAISDPFLPARIRGLEVRRGILPALHEFHDDLYGSYREILFGPAHALDKMKEVWSYFSGSIGGVSSEFSDLTRSRSFESYERAVSEIFERGIWKK